MKAEMDVGTNRKAFQINLDAKKYGTFAEVGAAPAHRDMTWNLVGKRGLGSVEVDPDDENVYTVDLYDKKLYRLPLAPHLAWYELDPNFWCIWLLSKLGLARKIQVARYDKADPKPAGA